MANPQRINSACNSFPTKFNIGVGALSYRALLQPGELPTALQQ